MKTTDEQIEHLFHDLKGNLHTVFFTIENMSKKEVVSSDDLEVLSEVAKRSEPIQKTIKDLEGIILSKQG